MDQESVFTNHQTCSSTSLLSDVSGSIYTSTILYMFTYNSQYGGHGTALYYLPQLATGATQTRLVMDGCNFSYNRAAKSVIYIGGSVNMSFQWQNSVFQ